LDQKFWVWPVDKCTTAELDAYNFTEPIPYFLGSKILSIKVNATNDTVSKATDHTDNPFCGKRNYYIFKGPDWLTKPAFANVPVVFEPVITVQTNNEAHLGVYNLSFVTRLVTYSKPTNHSYLTL
jgi:hypothetical protein